MEKETTAPAQELTPYEKTQEMMRRLLAVPKQEVTTQYSADRQKITARKSPKMKTEKQDG